MYDRGWLRSYRASVPVVCVGNLACGGTGKTPTVMALVRMLEEAGHRPGILTRGYKGTQQRPADEVLLYARTVPKVPVIVGGDRVAAAKKAVRENDVDVLVMDDGFGHRRLARDLDIVLLAEPLENIRLLPQGLYREPVSSLGRTDVVIRTFDDNTDVGLRAARRAVRLVGQDGSLGLDQLAGKQVLAFCGIGDPAGFERMLEAAGARLAMSRPYADHHRYSQGDVDELARIAGRAGCYAAVTTMKDWVKIEHDGLSWPGGDCRLWALDIKMEFYRETEKLLRDRLTKLFAD